MGQASQGYNNHYPPTSMLSTPIEITKEDEVNWIAKKSYKCCICQIKIIAGKPHAHLTSIQMRKRGIKI
jgi:hypothetical protein